MSTTVSKDVVTVAGPDAKKFLHSLVSQDVASLEPGAERWSFLLQPQGRVVGFFTIALLPKRADEPDASDTFELVLDAGAGAAVRDALQRYLIRTKATLTLSESEDRPGLRDDERIAAGLPRWGREMTETTIPNETGLTALAVNFTKGCYVGQELVERIDARGGNVPKRLCLLRLDGDVVPTDGVAELEVGGKVVGSITSAAIDPGTGHVIALGYVRREVADGDQVDVRWGNDVDGDQPGVAGHARATVAALPSSVGEPDPDVGAPVARAGIPRFTSGRP